MPKELYGLQWPPNADPVQIEFAMIQAGGFIEQGAVKYGKGLAYHYQRLFDLLWPEDDNHRWSELCLRRKTENPIVVLMGCGDSN